MAHLYRITELGVDVFADDKLSNLLSHFQENALHWFDIDFTGEDNLHTATETFGLHPLLADDIRNRQHLPKYESFEDLVFLTCKMLTINRINLEVNLEHLSLILGKNFVLSFQDNVEGDSFDALRKRIHSDSKRFQRMGADFLFISLLDAVVDEYNLHLEAYRKQIEDLETHLIKHPGMRLMGPIMKIKSELADLRRHIAPLRDEVIRLKIEQSSRIRKHNMIFLRDVLDHLNLLVSTFENYREMLRDITELHHSNQNLELNNIVKTLTVISAIFIPLTFIVGVYGMNFEIMPELKWRYGYLFSWVIMLGISAAMLYQMRKRRWF
jgi:magnesium transporter